MISTGPDGPVVSNSNNIVDPQIGQNRRAPIGEVWTRAVKPEGASNRSRGQTPQPTSTPPVCLRHRLQWQIPAFTGMPRTA